MEEEKIYQQKVFKLGAISIGVCLLIAYWYATQGVAEECGYSKLLGACLNIGDVHIYPPYKFYVWQQNAVLMKAIPEIIRSYAAYPYIGFVIGAGFTYLHGSATFATAKEIDEAGLGKYADKKSGKIKKSGVVVGVNPYNKHLMLHDGVEHILLVAPTRSGKGVNTVRLVQ